ncbi:hypothetical protein [Dendrosporobacter sp. 1207_IL3150]|uniref:hypothetical protein n=1 Tax=Dendrosporobacter sp. 1207_IL3150 TaxID=3084054 RepID=UPI002FD9570F
MVKKSFKTLAVVSLLLIVVLVAGCGGGGSGAKRISGLSPDGVVKTFFNAAKSNNLNEAKLYVSPVSSGDVKTAIKFMTGSGLTEIQKSNLASIKLAKQQGDFAVVVATLQEENSFRFTVKPIGLEKIDGEWYIVDFEQIYQNAKYKVLQQLLANI